MVRLGVIYLRWGVRMTFQRKIKEIADGIYWVGVYENAVGLQCNPYLLVEQDEAVLIDPGSVLDFEYVFKNIESIIPIQKIKYVVLHHQDPDFCSSVPLFEKAGAKFTIVTTWRTQTLVKYYGVTSKYYLLDVNDFKLNLNSGRELQFIPTPYLHFAGAFVTYDKQSKILFSSDLFGGFSNNGELYAGKDYMEKMKAFHEHYMPSNDILRPVMQLLLLMDIHLIAPQHGCIIHTEIPQYIKALRDLECGSFMRSITKELKESGGYAGLCETVLKRYASIYSTQEVQEALSGLNVVLEKDSVQIKDYESSGVELWENLFQRIYLNKDIKWLLVVEPLVQKLCKEYELPLPSIYQSQIKHAQQATILLTEEVLELQQLNDRLNQSIEQTQERIITCPVTGLYNQAFFKEHLQNELEYHTLLQDDSNTCLAIIGLDNMARFRYTYGDAEADNLLKSVAYLLKEIETDHRLLFRLQGDQFAYILPNISKEAAVLRAENICNTIKISEKFIEEVTVSIGVSSQDEVEKQEREKAMLRTALSRFRIAKRDGGNFVCSESQMETKEAKGKIMVVDMDSANQEILKTSLNNLKYDVVLASDGLEAFALAEKELPDLIVSEIMLPKIDGFVLCEKLLQHSATKNISFMILSDLKNDDSVKRALKLGVEHYFKKPYILYEILGIIQMKVKRENLDEYQF